MPKYPCDRQDRQIATYVPARTAEAIDAAAHKIGLSRAAWLRTTLTLALDQPDEPTGASRRGGEAA